MDPSLQVPRRSNGLAMMMSDQLQEKRITSSPRFEYFNKLSKYHPSFSNEFL